MSMRWYVARRLLWAVFATFVVLSGYFLLLQVAPGDGRAAFAFEAATSGGNVTQAQQTFEQIRGLQGSLTERYVRYMGNMATGDWGWSFTRNQPVVTAMAEAYPYSLQYALPATLLASSSATASDSTPRPTSTPSRTTSGPSSPSSASPSPTSGSPSCSS